MDKTIQLEIAKLGDEVKKVVRRQDELQKSLDLLFADREIMEDMQGSIKHLQEIILQNQVHQDNGQKDLKAEIREAGAIVEDKVHEIKKEIGEKTVIVKSKTENIFMKIKSMLKGVKKT